MTPTTPGAAPASVGRQPRRRSLRLRLTAVYTLLFLLGGTALLGVTYVLVEHATGKQITYVSPDGHYSISLSGEPSKPSGSGEGSGVGAGSQRSYSPSTGGPTDDPQVPPADDADQLRSLALQQHADAMHQLLLQGGLALGLVTLASAGLGWYVSGRMLKPLRTITGTVREISASNLHRRLGLTGRRDELTELGDTFDSLLDRLEASFDAQRQFVANASHELRTPLARQRAIGQVALGDPDASAAELRAAHERILAAGREQEQLIEALLDLARGQSDLQRQAQVGLPQLVAKALEAQEPEAVTDRVGTSLDTATTVGDPRLLERLVLNLVANAFRHSPDGSRIEITTATLGGKAVLTIGNRGPVLSPDEVSTLTRPFRRGHPDRTASHGLGLGLTIVQAVARAHDAELELASAEDGAFSVRVAFEAAPRTPTRFDPTASARSAERAV
jgi:signal transduction histidine kinase